MGDIQTVDQPAIQPPLGIATSMWMLSPPLAALAYPFLLKLFSALMAAPRGPTGENSPMANAVLFAAMCVPLYGLYIAVKIGGIEHPSAFQVRARRLALFSMAAPPLFVLFGVALGLVGSPIRDVTLWTFCWSGAVLLGAAGARRRAISEHGAPPRLRIAHGAMAALLTVFLAFHLSNHLAGLIGPDVHARVMAIGRTVYRSGIVEPALVALLLAQIASGGRLAWAWTGAGGGFHRTIQIGSGVYIGAFILTHLNSALVSARLRDVPTNWAWASGAPDGLYYDPWNIRLLPHYAFGVLFILIHLSSGLRVVLIAHGVNERTANAVWIMGVIAGAAVAVAITAALLGARI